MTSPNGLIDPARLPLFMQPLALFPGYPLLHVAHEVATSISGGSLASGQVKRTLNAVKTNEIAGASLASSSITLPAGEYYAEGYHAITGNVNRLKTYLGNDTTGAIAVLGDALYGTLTTITIKGQLRGRFTVSAASEVLSFYMRTTNGEALSDAQGVSGGFAGYPERYADLMIWKLK